MNNLKTIGGLILAAGLVLQGTAWWTSVSSLFFPSALLIAIGVGVLILALPWGRKFGAGGSVTTAAAMGTPNEGPDSTNASGYEGGDAAGGVGGFDGGGS